MNREELKQKLRWKGLKSIEFRVLGWMARAVVVFSFVVYLAANTMSAWTWAEVKWVRAQDISRLDVLLKDAAAHGNFSWVETWMRFRPSADSKELIARATPYGAHLSPFVFFDFSDRAAQLGDKEQADLWNMIAHFRMRFDLLRCGLSDGVEQGRKMLDLLALLHKSYDREIPDETRMRLARKVLEFDDKYPAADDPAGLCKILSRVEGVDYQPLPQDQWDSFRKGMHVSTEFTLGIEEKKRLQKAGPVKDKKK